MKINEILQLKYPNANFRKDIILRDDGDGVIYIAEWNLSDPRPTQADLNQWGTELDLPYRQKQAVLKRQYPPIGDQLDMLYKDKINNTTVWTDTITSLKNTNPKPTV